MPARIVLVHDDLELLTVLEGKLRDRGHDVAVFEDSISAFDVLRSAGRIEILVTRVAFRPRQPHGIALAAAARLTRPSLEVIFTALREFAHFASGDGLVLIMPVHPDQIVQAVEELLNTRHAPAVRKALVGR